MCNISDELIMTYHILRNLALREGSFSFIFSLVLAFHEIVLPYHSKHI